MAFKNNAYATLWNLPKKDVCLDKHEKYIDINITTSRKNAEGTYVTDFANIVRCVGRAFDALNKYEDLEKKSRIQLLSTEVSNIYNREEKKTYYSFVCWDLTVEDIKDKKLSTKQPEVVGELQPLDIPDEGLPF